jgi:hypothetical protein
VHIRDREKREDGGAGARLLLNSQFVRALPWYIIEVQLH